MKLILIFTHVIAITIGGIIVESVKDKETITVYTPWNIYFLEGTKIIRESGSTLNLPTRQEAVEALEQMTASDSNTPVWLNILLQDIEVNGETRTVIDDILVSEFGYHMADFEVTYLEGKCPLDVILDAKDYNTNLVSILYDY